VKIFNLLLSLFVLTRYKKQNQDANLKTMIAAFCLLIMCVQSIDLQTKDNDAKRLFINLTANMNKNFKNLDEY
jgi:hypothetical protein